MDYVIQTEVLALIKVLREPSAAIGVKQSDKKGRFDGGGKGESKKVELRKCQIFVPYSTVSQGTYKSIVPGSLVLG